MCAVRGAAEVLLAGFHVYCCYFSANFRVSSSCICKNLWSACWRRVLAMGTASLLSVYHLGVQLGTAVAAVLQLHVLPLQYMHASQVDICEHKLAYDASI